MSRPQSSSDLTPIPFAVIAECFKNRGVVPFLGAAASFVGADLGSCLPSGAGLARLLAAYSYPGSAEDPLGKIAQFIEEVPADRPFLLGKVESIFFRDLSQSYRSSLTDFVLDLPVTYMPRLLITTNYDVLLERAFESRGIPYLAISQVMRNSPYAGRFICYESLQQQWDQCILTRTALEERFVSMQEDEPDRVLLYKMHGTARIRHEDNFIDSIVVTESDYVEVLEDNRLNKVPSRILDLMRKSNLLFLGYSLEDWNFRVLLQRLERIQTEKKEHRKKHWACRLMDTPDEVEQRFWNLRGIQLYSISLDTFLSQLKAAIKELSS
jgi:SIR2-like domain